MKSILTIILFFCCLSSFATGPSSIRSELYPLSINEKGDILCRTRFEKNWMGAHVPMTVEYGLCVITGDTIIEYLTRRLIPDLENDEPYYNERELLDKKFRLCLNYNHTSALESRLIDEYGFRECNCEPYKVDKVYSFNEFTKEKDVDLKSNRQKTLKNTTSRLSYGNIKVAYDFGNVLILDNIGEDETKYGTNFNFQYPLHYTWLTYEWFTISGVLFLTDILEEEPIMILPLYVSNSETNTPSIIETDKEPIRIDDTSFILNSIQLQKAFEWIEGLPRSLKERRNIDFDELYKIHKNTITENYFVLHLSFYRHDRGAEITRRGDFVEIETDILSSMCYSLVYVLQDNGNYNVFAYHCGPVYDLSDGTHLDTFGDIPFRVDKEFAQNVLICYLQEKGISKIEPQTLHLSRKEIKRIRNLAMPNTENKKKKWNEESNMYTM